MWNALKYGTWNVSQPRTSAVNALVGGGYAPLAAMILASRGLDTPEKANAYLDCSCNLLDPFLMTDMDLAAGRVFPADQGNDGGGCGPAEPAAGGGDHP